MRKRAASRCDGNIVNRSASYNRLKFSNAAVTKERNVSDEHEGIKPTKVNTKAQQTEQINSKDSGMTTSKQQSTTNHPESAS